MKYPRSKMKMAKATVKVPRSTKCAYCGYSGATPIKGPIQPHEIQQGDRTVTVMTHTRCLSKLRRAQEDAVTLRIPYMNVDKNPIHTLRKRDVFVVRERRSPRMRGNTMVAGEVILDLQKGPGE